MKIRSKTKYVCAEMCLPVTTLPFIAQVVRKQRHFKYCFVLNLDLFLFTLHRAINVEKINIIFTI